MRAVEESARMRSLICCGVSRTACARVGGADTIIPKKALVTKHHPRAPSLAGCMRVVDPHVIIQVEGPSLSAISRTVPTMPGMRLLQRSLPNLCGCEVRHEKKQEGVRGNVEIEIGDAMHEKTAAGHETGKLQGPGKGIV